MFNPVSSRHPLYTLDNLKWSKWREAYEGGEDFIVNYMQRLSDRESDADFTSRKNMAYCPRFAGAAIDDIKNAIFQRMVDVVRVDGPSSYQEAVAGLNGGVDLDSSTMGSFIGQKIISELLVLSRVGILVDMPKASELGMTQADRMGKRPYINTYQIEQILNWTPTIPVNGFNSILLAESVEEFDDYGLPEGMVDRYRLMRKVPEGVEVTFFDAKGEILSTEVLTIPKIPFVIMSLPISFMSQIADYQIALMNLESSDIAFARKANYPFYYEFYDPKTEPTFTKSPADPSGTGTAAEAKSKNRETRIGLSQGRRFPAGAEKPGFINPDPDTLRVSMEKGEQLKQDIRLIVNLSLSALNPQRQAADSKEFVESRSLEAGLSHIGLVLQKGEQQVGELWTMFEGERVAPKVSYPKSYALLQEDDRLAQAEKYNKVSASVQSKTFKSVIAKKIANVLVRGDVTEETFQKITAEIDAAPTQAVDPDVILRAHEEGLVDDITGSTALGFDGAKVIPQARLDRAERIKLTLEAQGGPQNADSNRGAADFGDGADEKTGKQQRGDGKSLRKGENV